MQIRLSEAEVAESPKIDAARNDHTHEIADDVAYRRLMLVNVVFIGGIENNNWVLVDAGIPGMADTILSVANARFKEQPRPSAIILTHGHFDHVGSLVSLAEKWNVPIYAHPLEVPYLNGTASYPAPDPFVGGGVMSLLSPLYPRGPINVSKWLGTLPADGTVPELPGWRWIHTPGHTPGHVSLWRSVDKTLVAGDAFITTGQESAYAVATQRPEMHGPPMYYTQNWVEAAASVRTLAKLEPELAITGHGHALCGGALRQSLHQLAQNFEQIAVPRQSHYDVKPATVADGSAYVIKK